MCAADDQGRTRRRRHAYQAILISLCTCELCQDPVRCGSVRGMRGLVHLVRCRCSRVRIRVRIRMNKMRRPWMSSYRQQAPAASICGRVRCARAVERCPRPPEMADACPQPAHLKRFHHRRPLRRRFDPNCPTRAGRGADPDFRIPPSGWQINIQNGNKDEPRYICLASRRSKTRKNPTENSKRVGIFHLR